MNVSEEASKGKRPAPKRDGWDWDLLGKQADVAYKVVISFFGAIAAGVFLFYQYQETDKREFTQLQSTRENSDNSLRATMFKTLFESYFASKIQTSGPTMGIADELKSLQHEILLGDVLSRNFETIDMRPVYEDLDRRLTDIIFPQADSEVTYEQKKSAFRQRERLRRVASGATQRQTTTLQSLAGDARAVVTNHLVLKSCMYGEVSVNPPLTDVLEVADVKVEVKDLDDGKLRLNVRSAEGVALPRPFIVTYYDMPMLENFPLRTGQRVAFVFTHYISREYCQYFQRELDPVSLQFCGDVSGADGICAIGSFSTVVLPKNFLGLRERPYQNDLDAGRYRAKHWWEVW
jgi:hypothetical protein